MHEPLGDAFSEEELEARLLAHFVRLSKSRDRDTGEVSEQGDPILCSNTAAITGDTLAVTSTVSVKGLAMGFCGLNTDPKAEKEDPKAVPTEWRDRVAFVEDRLGRIAYRLRERHGVFVLNPQLDDEGKWRFPDPEVGRIQIIQITRKGMEYARSRIQGTKWERHCSERAVYETVVLGKD